jgi:hypothetical protein
MHAPARFILTNHAVVVMKERGISVEWVRRALEHPHLRIPDPVDADLLHALVAIPEREDRVLRVVYNKGVHPWRVVTAYFDRAWKGML